MKIINCPLCKAGTQKLGVFEAIVYFQCKNCKGIFKHPEFYLSLRKEYGRYQLHENDVNDKAYQNFVSPITHAIQQNFSTTKTGLDFGCGSGPVAAKILNDHGYTIKLYDPFFYNLPENLDQKYDFIVCCEVMEHFHHPNKEFKLLRNLLHQSGRLYCKTEILSSKTINNFKDWWYKNDPTHVFFYTTETLAWIKQHFGFLDLKIHSDYFYFQL